MGEVAGRGLFEGKCVSNLFCLFLFCLSPCIVLDWPGIHYVDTPFLTSDICPPLT